MNKGQSLTGLFAMGLSLAGCMFFYHGPAEKIVLDAEVLVTDEDGSPTQHQRIYILETFGNTRTITLDSMTDESGRIFLKGTYCTPMIVSSDTGGIVIKPPAETHYLITARPGYGGLVKGYGQVDPRLRPAMIAQWRRNCR